MPEEVTMGDEKKKKNTTPPPPPPKKEAVEIKPLQVVAYSEAYGALLNFSEDNDDDGSKKEAEEEK
jgi:hypothetical protein